MIKVLFWGVVLTLLFLSAIVQTLDLLFNLHDWWERRKMWRKIYAMDKESDVSEETSKETD